MAARIKPEAGTRRDARYSDSPMCGRTALAANPEDLRAALGLDETPALAPRYNVTPSQAIAVLRTPRGSTSRKLELLRWGLVPAWAKDVRTGNKLGLARVERVTITPLSAMRFADDAASWSSTASSSGDATESFEASPSSFGEPTVPRSRSRASGTGGWGTTAR